jgi:hypothetical protein
VKTRKGNIVGTIGNLAKTAKIQYKESRIDYG